MEDDGAKLEERDGVAEDERDGELGILVGELFLGLEELDLEGNDLDGDDLDGDDLDGDDLEGDDLDGLYEEDDLEDDLDDDDLDDDRENDPPIRPPDGAACATAAGATHGNSCNTFFQCFRLGVGSLLLLFGIEEYSDCRCFIMMHGFGTIGANAVTCPQQQVSSMNAIIMT